MSSSREFLAALRAPGADESLPPVDEHIVEPETRYEIIDGERIYVVPAGPLHGTEHCDLGYLLRAHGAEGYRVAVDMLTRTDAKNEMAPDASIYPGGPDPETGGRKLEELAFEISDTQSRANVTKRARKFAGRGVRRVFLLDVKRKEVLEWDAGRDKWRLLGQRDVVDDRCLCRPLRVEALVDAAKRDDEVARALLARKNRVIEEAMAESRKEGQVQSRAEGILQVLEARQLEIPDEARQRILRCTDLDLLGRWLTRAATVSSAHAVFDPQG